MKKAYFIILLLPFIFSCSSGDDSNSQQNENEEMNNDEPISTFVKTITQTHKPDIDSIFYENELIKTHTHYIGNELKYKIEYTYNSNHQLVLRKNEGYIDPEYISINEFQYDNNGNLVKRLYTYNGGSVKTTTYSYSTNLVEINQHDALFYKLNLDNNNIVSIEQRDTNSGEYIIEWLLEYDNDGKINKLSKRLSGGNSFIDYYPSYDDKENPFHVFEFKLPNNLSINLLENPDYSGIYGGLFLQDFYRYIGYFHKNNLVKTIGPNSGYISFIYTYNSIDYPTKIVKLNDPDSNAYILSY